jgi:hypothetical protein
MSVMIAHRRLIDDIVAFLSDHRFRSDMKGYNRNKLAMELPSEFHDIRHEGNKHCEKAQTALGRALEDLNQRAYCKRYPSAFVPSDYSPLARNQSQSDVKMFKSLQFWHSEWSDHEDFEGKALYNAIGRIIHMLAVQIVCESEAYNAATWGRSE